MVEKKRFVKKVEYKPTERYEGYLVAILIITFINWYIGESWLYGLIFAVVTFILSVIVGKFFIYRKVYYEEV